MKKSIPRKLRRLARLNAGFTALEWIIAAVLIAIVLVNVGKFIVITMRNGQAVQILANTSILSTQKATELFNDSKNQVAKIPEGETRIGSIDPNQPLDGYFDLFNGYACLLRNTTPAPPLKITVDNQSSNNSSTPNTSTGASLPGKGGPLGGPLDGDTSDGNPLPKIDCSTSTHTNPKESLDPRYRRQWLIVKDFPNASDVTYFAAVVELETKKTIQLYSLTKTDGAITK